MVVHTQFCMDISKFVLPLYICTVYESRWSTHIWPPPRMHINVVIPERGCCTHRETFVYTHNIMVATLPMYQLAAVEPPKHGIGSTCSDSNVNYHPAAPPHRCFHNTAPVNLVLHIFGFNTSISSQLFSIWLHFFDTTPELEIRNSKYKDKINGRA